MDPDALAALRDRGQRTWKRFEPDERLMADLSLPSSPLGAREVLDLSMGGAKLAVRARDTRRLVIGARVRLRLDLGARDPVVLLCRVVHIQNVGGAWFGQWSVGLVFPLGHALDEARPALARYLTRLSQRHARAAS